MRGSSEQPLRKERATHHSCRDRGGWFESKQANDALAQSAKDARAEVKDLTAEVKDLKGEL